MYADACGRMLTYAAASQMPLAIVRVCMLTHADVCSRMLLHPKCHWLLSSLCWGALVWSGRHPCVLWRSRFFLPISWIYVLSEPTLDRFRSLGKVRGEILTSSRDSCVILSLVFQSWVRTVCMMWGGWITISGRGVGLPKHFLVYDGQMLVRVVVFIVIQKLLWPQ
jgi:hypothetical protein